ncbi:S8 family peptidase [Dokdonella sp.]|uniref:S8 family peptidase n=1 Tax=Dokdonella sp. TaxID=2291710 RepID=UPI003C5486F4
MSDSRNAVDPATGPSASSERFCWCLPALLCWLLSSASSLHAEEPATDDDRRIIVAIEEQADPAPMIGSSARGYGALPNYSGSARTLAASARLALDHDLSEVSAWTIDPLRVRCMLYEISPGSEREDVLARLRQDRRVRLAQPLQEFSTFSKAAGVSADSGRDSLETQFNDPYVALQIGFDSIGAATAQRLANGDDIRIALIDTSVDAAHPDLHGRIVTQRDFVDLPTRELDRHATEVAGVIAAVANNGIGIVGVSPGVTIYSYRACWPVDSGGSAARCNSFTLAQALAAAIDSDAQIINLSLGGPHDPLLEQLLDVAFSDGMIVVGATPIGGVPEGFPSGVAGVIAVRSSTADVRLGMGAALAAPGEQILTLEPGGSYDYASGSSLATAHVTGTIALLLQLVPGLDAPALSELLGRTSKEGPGLIDACAAVHAVRRAQGSCIEQLSGLSSGIH